MAPLVARGIITHTLSLIHAMDTLITVELSNDTRHLVLSNCSSSRSVSHTGVAPRCRLRFSLASLLQIAAFGDDAAQALSFPSLARALILAPLACTVLRRLSPPECARLRTFRVRTFAFVRTLAFIDARSVALPLARHCIRLRMSCRLPLSGGRPPSMAPLFGNRAHLRTHSYSSRLLAFAHRSEEAFTSLGYTTGNFAT